ncbi:MAG TPA: DNA polymerase/3'-5' exonuclease PolX [Gemmatimonadales bacterium]|nr:DNA polymerase/3'-5' exonuclease PolX [Gemmatimonadales bacterium]
MTDRMEKRGVSDALDQIAALMELKGENLFRVRTFRTVAKVVGGLPGTLRAALDDGSLAATKGVGPATLEVISELAATGSSVLLEELQEQVPPGLVEMLSISGLGVAKIRQIHDTLGIESLPELEAAAADGRLAGLPRFGQKTADNIRKSIAFLRQASAFRLAHHAAEEARALVEALGRVPGVLGATAAGEVRRRSEVVQDIVVVLVAEVPAADIFARLGHLPGVHEFAGQDERHVTLRFVGGSSAQVIVTPPQNAGAVLVQATGSDSHLRDLEGRATAQGCSLRGAALWRGSAFVPTPDEAAFYAALDLPWIPPELREGGGEVEAGAAKQLPALLEASQLRGFLHCHTNYSDGSNSVADLAGGVRAAGYEWIGITDHSQSAAYAGGLSPEALRRQAAEIAEVGARLDGFRILHGIEADILVDGRLDYDDDVLARLDFVIGSIHSRFNLGGAEMTARMLAALDNPYLTILGHPTGRLLLSRDAYAIDLDAVFEKAGARGVAIEINADPHRLDLDWRVLRRARAQGVMISIGSDAHNLAGLANVDYGVGIARKGWLEAAEVLNTRSAEEFLAFGRARRR